MSKKRGIRVPTGCDPAIAALMEAINEAPMPVGAIADRAGVNESTIWNWICGNRSIPNVSNLRAVLNALGYELEVVRKP